MKKKFLSAVSLVLAYTMAAASLTGCGTQAKATDQEIEDGETIIVTEEEEPSEDDAIIETEDETTETEVVEEEEASFAGAENEDIVLYAEIAEYGKYMPFTDQTFEPETNTVIAYEDIPIYNEMGVEVGYVKNGSTITLTESATEIYWARFENPIEGTDYEYLYMIRDYIAQTERVENSLSADEMKEIIIDALDQVFAEAKIVNTPTSDMEVYEFVISNENNTSAINHRLDETIFMGSDAYKYTTFYVECTEDADGEPYIHCKVFYKDLYDDAVSE